MIQQPYINLYGCGGGQMMQQGQGGQGNVCCMVERTLDQTLDILGVKQPTIQQQITTIHSTNKKQQLQQQTAPYSNIIKTFDNLMYCYSCRYDVNYDGWNCPWDWKPHHMPHVTRDMANTVPCVSIHAEHKTLANDSGEGKAWLMKQQLICQMYGNTINYWWLWLAKVVSEGVIKMLRNKLAFKKNLTQL